MLEKLSTGFQLSFRLDGGSLHGEREEMTHCDACARIREHLLEAKSCVPTATFLGLRDDDMYQGQIFVCTRVGQVTAPTGRVLLEGTWHLSFSHFVRMCTW